MKRKCIVLLSGGLDSTVNLYWAMEELDVIGALTLNYGQRAAEKEKEYAAFHCHKLGVNHLILDVNEIFSGSKSSLVNLDMNIPQQEVNIESLTVSQETAKSVWVPNRNGLFLNIAACVAEKMDAKYIIPGFNKEEAQTFPDNSQGFIEAMNQSLKFSTKNQVEVRCFTTDLVKAEIMEKAMVLGVDINHLWPCYFDGSHPCGACESCQRFKRARQQC